MALSFASEPHPYGGEEDGWRIDLVRKIARGRSDAASADVGDDGIGLFAAPDSLNNRPDWAGFDNSVSAGTKLAVDFTGNPCGIIRSSMHDEDAPLLTQTNTPPNGG